MKSFIKISFLFFSVFLFGQEIEKDTLLVYGEKKYQDIEDIRAKFYRLENQNDIFIYKKNRESYAFYDRTKYDSLKKNTNEKDSIILSNSIIKLKYKGATYIKFRPNLTHETYEIKKYDKYDNLVAVLSYSDEGFRINDFSNKIYFSYSPTRNLYMFIKYKNINKSNKFFNDAIYSLQLKKDGKIIEHNYEKDFPISEEEILKCFPEKFYKQAIELVEKKEYSRYTIQKNDDGKIISASIIKNYEPFNKSDAAEIRDYLKYLIKNNKEEIRIDKVYEKDVDPILEINFVYVRNAWNLKLNPKNGDILKIDYGFLTE